MGLIITTEDGNFFLSPQIGNVVNQKSTIVHILANPDVATVALGQADHNDNFKAYADGLITDDTIVNHGKGAKPMVQVSGTGAGDLVIWYSND